MSPRPVHVLHVDDDRSATQLVSRMLTSVGHRVTSARGAAEGLAVVESDPPDIILSDVVMAPGDGLFLLAALQEKGASPPVVLLTSVDDEVVLAEARRLGMAAHLTKPVGTDLLVKAIAEVLKSRDRR